MKRFGQGIEQLARAREGANGGEHVVIVIDGWHPDAPVADSDALGAVAGRAAITG